MIFIIFDLECGLNWFVFASICFKFNINDRFDNEVVYPTQNPPIRFIIQKILIFQHQLFFHDQLYVCHFQSYNLKNVLKILLTNVNEEDAKVTLWCINTHLISSIVTIIFGNTYCFNFNFLLFL
jgi:hypothetical protein